MAVDNSCAPLILTVHKLRSGRWYDHTSLRPLQFRYIIQALIDGGFRVVDTSTAAQDPRLDRFAVTFDDGYASLADTLPPICEEFALRPTVFMPTAFIGQKNSWDYTSAFWPERHLDTSQIRELASAGIEFGSHGHFHRPLTSLTVAQLKDELNGSKLILEEILGREVISTSYPFGRVSDQVAIAVREAGYRYGFGTSWPDALRDGLHIGRISLYSFDTPLSVMKKVRGRLTAIEKIKGEIAAYMSGGTGILQRLRGSCGR